MEEAIKIDSVTTKSNESMIRFLTPLLEETGLKVFEQSVTENGIVFKNLIALSGSATDEDLLVLHTHLDTVSPGDTTAWTKTNGNPFAATRVRDRIYGLGTADVKLDFLCKIWAARLTKPWQRPLALVGTYGEERGLIGVGKLFEQKKLKPRYALVGEPSNLELIYAHKGHMVFTIVAPLEKTAGELKTKSWRGKAAHSSTPHLGENAIRKALDDTFKRGVGLVRLEGGTDSNRIPDFCEADVMQGQGRPTSQLFQLFHELDEWSRELKRRRDTRFSPSHNTLSLNMARSEGGELRLTFDIRILPDTKTASLRERLESIVKAAGLSLAEISIDPPLKGLKNGTLMKVASQALKEAGARVVKKTKASSTEAAVYQENGAEALVFGPGISVGNVHRPNEFNSIQQMEIATRFYANVIRTPLGDY